ncbi:MAG: NYN domain-containing protein [Gemmatimonadota bacterium]
MSGEESRTVIVDGSNVAHSSEGEKAQLDNIRVIRDKLLDEGYDPVIVADAALRHQIDDETAFEQMVESGEIRQAPAGTDADFFILSFARELAATVVSNDRFKDRAEAFPEIRDRVIRYMIINGEAVLERRTNRRRA